MPWKKASVHFNRAVFGLHLSCRDKDGQCFLVSWMLVFGNYRSLLFIVRALWSRLLGFLIGKQIRIEIGRKFQICTSLLLLLGFNFCFKVLCSLNPLLNLVFSLFCCQQRTTPSYIVIPTCATSIACYYLGRETAQLSNNYYAKKFQLFSPGMLFTFPL